MNRRKGKRQTVIVGAGQAGLRAATALRDLGYEENLVLVGDERHLPYERPQLSKSCLAAADAAHKPILGSDDLAQLDIEVRTGWPVSRIDRARNVVVGPEGAELAYDALVLALGGTARAFPGVSHDGRRIFVLRSADDAAALSAAADGARNALVVGGGWLGLEIAASLRGRGLEVTIVEAGERLCGRVAPPEMSRRLTDLHEGRGNRVLTGVGIETLDIGEQGVAAKLSSGAVIAADIAVIAIGMTANAALASQAGLAVGQGIVVDELCRTSDPAIYAIGDCAEQFHAPLGVGTRLESWQNANSQAEIAAAAILGVPAPPVRPPWFWSDQFDMNIQMLGDTRGHLESIERGGQAETAATLYLRDGKLAGIVAFNAPRDIGMARRLIETGAPLDKAKASDPALPLSKARID